MKEKFVLAIDVAKGKSMVSLISSSGEVLISPYEINHTLNDFKKLDERIKNLSVFNDTAVIMESTGIYQMPVKRFFLENNYSVYIINPMYGKMYKQNLRKTKTDKEDCLKLAELFFIKDFKQYIEPKQSYLNLNAMSREYNTLIEAQTKLKNEFKNKVYEVFPEYEKIFKGNLIYSNTSLEFIKKYPHANIIANTRVDALANTMSKLNNRHENYYLNKAKLIKEYASNSYPSVPKDDQKVDNLLITIDLLLIHITKVEKLKTDMIEKAKSSYMFDLINSLDGIGEFTSALIIAELGDISRFDNIKQLTAYCGLDPSIKQSGSSINVNGPISKSGNRYIRRIMFVTIQNLIPIASRNFPDNDILLYYRKKRNEGKHHYVAVVDSTTKLLRKIFALVKQYNNNI